MNMHRDPHTPPVEHTSDGAPAIVAGRLRDVAVPAGAAAMGHAFAWLGVFLLALMAFTGILLGTIYVPSSAPATAADGTPLGLAVATDTVRWLGHVDRGEYLTLPIDPTGDSLLVPPGLAGRIAAVRDSATSRIVRPSAAWTSVEQTIQRHADLGWLIRGLHRGASGLLVATVILHLLTALFTGGWRRPRRATWIGGLALLVLVMAFAFSGSILPWNHVSFVAASIAAGFAADALPWLGPALAEIIRGSTDVAQTTLTRFHALHTTILPLFAVALLLWHLALVRRHGLATARSTTRSPLVPAALAIASAFVLILAPLVQSPFDPWGFVVQSALVALSASLAVLIGVLAGPRQSETIPLRVYLYRDLIAWILLSAALVTVVMLAPHSPDAAHLPVDLTAPVTTPENVHPEWTLRWAYELVSHLPAAAAFGVMLATLAVLAAIGARTKSNGNTKRPE